MDKNLTLYICKEGTWDELIIDDVKSFSFSTRGLAEKILFIVHTDGRRTKVFDVISFICEQ